MVSTDCNFVRGMVVRTWESWKRGEEENFGGFGVENYMISLSSSFGFGDRQSVTNNLTTREPKLVSLPLGVVFIRLFKKKL